jgi:hypothetical protein
MAAASPVLMAATRLQERATAVSLVPMADVKDAGNSDLHHFGV